MRPFALTLILLASQGIVSVAQQSDPSSDPFTCSASNPCKEGCCGKEGYCGFGPDFCQGSNCVGTCDAKSECDAGWGAQWSDAEKCPLNVCCSQYGFCGTTEEFCGDATVSSPSCGGMSTSQRIVGYYEGWAPSRPCDGLSPEDIPFEAYTHLNYAFAFIDPNSFTVALMDESDADLMPRLVALKRLNPGLQVWISIGGWSMNDPDQPTARTFSQLAGSSSAQSAFFSSLLSFMSQYGFDGVDIDWEYPVAPERSGDSSDLDNYPNLLQNLRNALGSSGHDYGLTITIPSSYWYMRHFDIVRIEPIVDWFNVMTYDLHGTWDSTDPYIGPYVYAHTNLTEIDQTMSLLWRNQIDPAKVTMGLGFYGRSFTLSDPSCTSAGCPFSAGAAPGPCSQNSGTLNYAEIEDVIANQGATVTFDQAAAVKEVVWSGNQWVSYDDEQTIGLKVDYANSHCLGGLMVWAASTDDSLGNAAAALSAADGRSSTSLAAISNAQSGLSSCMWGECNAPCPAGFSAAAKGSGSGGKGIRAGCPNGQSRSFCCPNSDVPSCQWRGTAPFCLSAGCKDDEVAVASDLSGGGHQCVTNHKNLCCKVTTSDVDLGQCQWTGSAPGCIQYDGAADGDHPAGTCPSGEFALTADKTGAGGEQPCSAFDAYKMYCCASEPYSNCGWWDGNAHVDYYPLEITYGPGSLQPMHDCASACPNGQMPIASETTQCNPGTIAYFCCDNPNVLAPLPDSGDPAICGVPDGVVDESGQPDESGLPDTEIELFEYEDDCYIGGVSGSGDASAPGGHTELRRHAFRHTHNHFHDHPSRIEWRRHEDVDEGWQELYGNATHSLVKRGPQRTSNLCKNKPGSSRNTVKVGFFSNSYPTIRYIVDVYKKKVYYSQGEACSVSGAALQSSDTLPPNIKMVAEHVTELQTVKSFLQGMRDGLQIGGQNLASGVLPWTAFSQQNAASTDGAWFQAWSDYGLAPPGGIGNRPVDTFMAFLGGTYNGNSNVNNLLALDAQTNGIKATLWAGAKNIIDATRWKGLNPAEQLKLILKMKAAFDYMNTGDAQAAFQYVYTNTNSAAQTFQTLLSKAGITYNFAQAWKDQWAAQFAFMGSNAQSFLSNTGYLQQLVDYWESSAAAIRYTSAVAKDNLASAKQLLASVVDWAQVGTGFMN